MAKDAKGHGSDVRGTMSGIRALGMSVKRTDGEWRVNHPGGREATAYYTTDNADALGTAQHMASKGGDKAAASALAAPGHPKSGAVPTHPAHDSWKFTSGGFGNRTARTKAPREFNGGHFAGGLGKFKGGRK